jgi:hypothetical protein
MALDSAAVLQRRSSKPAAEEGVWWVRDFIEEGAAFTMASHDDPVDAHSWSENDLRPGWIFACTSE